MQPIEKNTDQCQNIGTILGPCLGHIRAMFGLFLQNFATRCLKWLNFSLESHASQIEEYHSMSNYLDYIRAMFGPYQGHFLLLLYYLCI